MTPSLISRCAEGGPASLSTADLLALVTGREAAGLADLDAPALAGATVDTLRQLLDLSPAPAARLAAAVEVGRRAAQDPPRRGERCLDPGTVARLMADVAREPLEEFWIVLLDVRGRLLRRERIARGSLAQCPVSPRDTLRPAIRDGAHSVIFVHNHPSGDPSPSCEDLDLTHRLRAAAEIVGLASRDHVIVSAGGWYSFVQAGRWGR